MPAAIEVEGLTKRYGDTVAVDDVRLHVERGEVFGILGRNGAGKTTAVECVAGLRHPDAGTIRVLGLDPRRDRAALRQVLGVQLQESRLHGALKVRELVRMYRSFYRGGADPQELIEALGLEERRDTAFDDLSGGQQQRVSIALALVGRPRVVLLDELTTGLDPQARRDIWALVERLRDAGVTVVLISHVMEEVERLCDRVAIIDHGRIIAEDSPAGLIAKAGLAQRVRFETQAEPDLEPLRRLPEVADIERRGDEVVVTGEGDLLQVVSTALVEHGVVATNTRAERTTLDDAFLALTGRPLEPTSTNAGA